jgi:hypothetical protein
MRMAHLVKVVEAVVATPVFQAAALAWVPDTAAYDPGTLGGLLGFDFHLGVAGPQLIEINTNPGGALLNAVLARAQRACYHDAAGLAMGAMETPDVEEALVGVFMAEWGLQRKDVRLTSVAIFDEALEAQYLYPEFLLYRRLLNSHDIQVTICDPRALIRKDGRLWYESLPVDFVYNRLADFSLKMPARCNTGCREGPAAEACSWRSSCRQKNSGKFQQLSGCRTRYGRQLGVRFASFARIVTMNWLTDARLFDRRSGAPPPQQQAPPYGVPITLPSGVGRLGLRLDRGRLHHEPGDGRFSRASLCFSHPHDG